MQAIQKNALSAMIHIGYNNLVFLNRGLFATVFLRDKATLIHSSYILKNHVVINVIK